MAGGLKQANIHFLAPKAALAACAIEFTHASKSYHIKRANAVCSYEKQSRRVNFIQIANFTTSKWFIVCREIGGSHRFL
jgi:hypothetical protein